MTTIRIEIPKPHEAQRLIEAQQARFTVVACGRRFGKTELAKRRLVRGALRGLPVAYMAPTYKNMSEVWRNLKLTLQPVTARCSEQEHRLDLITGGVVECWSLEKAFSIRGRKYADVVVDEAAWVRDGEAWTAVIRPTLSDYKGTALFPSTPRGANWFWDLFNLGNDPLETEWASFQFPTTANPHIDAAEVESARRLLPDRLFRQEYLAEFIDDAGGVFRGVRQVATLKLGAPQAGRRYIGGIDWGRSNDFTVFSLIDAETKRQVYLDRFNQIGWDFQRARIKAAVERWQPALIYAEENSIGSVNIEALQADGIPVRAFATTADSKGPLIENLALAIERQEVALLDDPVQTAELQAYELERLPSGRYRYSAPPGKHDDTVIALALAWHGAYRSGPLIAFDLMD